MARAALGLDASGLKVLPGIIDLHGDAFERQMMPRPGVDFPIDVALADSDRQAIGNGITTVFHATTWSWEPGLRSADNARLLLEAIEAMRPQLAADTRFHLRQETYNLDAEAEISQWLSDGRIDLFAFNDHMDSTVANLAKPQKRSRMVERTGLTNEAFDALVARVVARAPEVPASIARLAETARNANVRMLSHDDDSPDMRKAFRGLGVKIAEFPVNEETARAAADAGDAIVFGAPNVVRGGSHTGWTRASDMIAKGLCSVLASDYYYPAQLLRRLPPRRRRRAAAGPRLGFDFGGAGKGGRAFGPGHAGGGLSRRHRPGRRRSAAAAAHRCRYRRRAPGSPDRREPADAFIVRAARGGCSRVSRLYADAMTSFPRYAIYYVAPPGSDLDRFGAALLGYDADRRQRPALSGRHCAVGAGLARGDARPAQIRLPCHAEGAAGAGAGQDRSRPARCVRNLCRHASGNPGDPAGRRFHQRLYRGRARASRRPNSSGSPRIACANSIPSARR